MLFILPQQRNTERLINFNIVLH